MDLLQWNVNGFQTLLLDLQALIYCCNLAIICLQETHVHHPHALNLCSYNAHPYDHPDSKAAIGRTAIIVKDCICCVPVTFHSLLQVIVVCMHLLSLFFTLCNSYLPPAVPVSPASPTSLILQLSLPLILVSDFNAMDIRWGTILADRRGRTVYDVCSGFSSLEHRCT
jgi:hypothetical protein